MTEERSGTEHRQEKAVKMLTCDNCDSSLLKPGAMVEGSGMIPLTCLNCGTVVWIRSVPCLKK